MRIAHFGPLPPLRTGVADYCVALLQELAPLAQVDLWVDQETISIPSLVKFRIVNYLERPHLLADLQHYDVLLYHMGNNLDFHANLFEVFLKHPGVVVLHDYVLHHFMAGYYLDRKNSVASYIEEMRYAYGNLGAELATAMFDSAGNYIGQGLPLWETRSQDYPLNKRIIEHARGIIVHSDYVFRRILAKTHTPIRKIPHLSLTASAPPQTATARADLGLNPNAFIVANVGSYGSDKRMSQMLQAISSVRAQIPETQLLLVGWGYPKEQIRADAASLGLDEDAVHIAKSVDSTKLFEDYVSAADVCIRLRYPTMGETSGAVMRAMALQRPVIVSNVGWYSELPDDCALKIDPDDLEVEILAESLLELHDNPELAAALGRKARDFVLQHHHPTKVVQEYMEFISEICSPTKNMQLRLAAMFGDTISTLAPASQKALVRAAGTCVAQLISGQ